jgi:hypothetical protein
MTPDTRLALWLAVGPAALSPHYRNEPVWCPAPVVACTIALLNKALEDFGEPVANALNPTSAATTSTGWVSLNWTAT